MDIYRSVPEFLSGLTLTRTWPALLELVRRAAASKPRDWWLPVRACQAVGGSPDQAVPAAAALACVQVAILLVDDLLDEDPRGEYRRIGSGPAANYASALQALGSQAFGSKSLPPAVRLQALDCLNRMLVCVSYGQHLDVQNPRQESAYWRVVDYKSASFFGCALKMGCLVAGVTGKTADGLERFGRLYGGMIQINDDLNDTMADPANPDWILGRSPLPILYAEQVDHPARARFLELRRGISRSGALQEAQQILIRCGAVSYCFYHLQNRHRAAVRLIDSLPLARDRDLRQLARALIAPVSGLLHRMESSGGPQ